MQKLGRETGKTGTKTRLKNHFSHCSFSIKKKGEKKEEEEEEEESKKERKKEKKRKEKKRKEKKRKKHSTFLTKVRETKPFSCGLRFLVSTISLKGDHKLEIYTSP